MKIKEIEVTANVAWSPREQHPVLMAAGTAAQQLDATFSTSATVDVYELNLTEPGLAMAKKSSAKSDHRFHKLVWGSQGGGAGVIVGGADGGEIITYSATKLLRQDEAVLSRTKKHTGPVRTLDFNPFQTNLLASGASDSEIYIWDLNNALAPMSPGAKSQPAEDVSCVSWNKQVQHILASTFSARCVVWDLRKNEPIMKVCDSASKIQCSAIAWHPDVATQLCLASEDDHSPVIQLWDLRFATAPLKTLESHLRGVLSIDWCSHDPDLLLSCGKDNRILCWNPNSSIQGGEVVCDLATSDQWSFEVSWCPRNPGVIASSSFDGHVCVYSLMGGQEQAVPSSDKIAESFPGMEQFAGPVPQQPPRTVVTLKKPPRWLRRPCGVSFGFGGRLVTFGVQRDGSISRTVEISQLVTESQLVRRSADLEAALTNNSLASFCDDKISSMTNDHERQVWQFMKASLEADPRSHFLQLLGYCQDEVADKVRQLVGMPARRDAPPQQEAEVAALMSSVGLASDGSLDPAASFDIIASNTQSLAESADALVEKDPEHTWDGPFDIPKGDGVDGLVSQALLTGNMEEAVELCLANDRMTDALVLAMAGGQELLTRTQQRYFQSVKTDLSRLMCAVVTDDWTQVVRHCDLGSWTEALVAALTHAKPEEFTQLCDILGSRLEADQARDKAVLCYICAGNLDRLVECWTVNQDQPDSPAALQNVVEQVMILRRSLQLSGRQADVTSGPLARKLTQYAELLAAQGSLTTALAYLSNTEEPTMKAVKDRISVALGQAPVASQPQPQPQALQQTRVEPRRPSYGYQPPAPVQAYQAPPVYPVAPQPSGMGVAPYQPFTPPASQPFAPAAPPAVFTPAQPSAQPAIFTPAAQPAVPPAMYTPAQPAVFTPAQPPAAPPPGQSPSATQLPRTGILSQRRTYAPDPTVQSGQYAYVTPQVTPQQFPAAPITHQPTYSLQNGQQGQDYAAGPYSNYSAPVPSSSASSAPQATNPTLPPMPAPAPPGWNDPPPLRPSSRKPKPEVGTPMEPITQPLIGAQEPPAPGPYPPQMYGYDQQMMYQPQGPAPVHPSQPPAPPQQQVTPARVASPEPPKPKGPIPAQHQVIQDVYETLRQQCAASATHPQMKRKLDDVSRKLEVLYDKLREGSLSDGTVSGLHQMVQLLQAQDYQSALHVHSQLVASSNLAEISAFMPGLKVLLQSAVQLTVYAQ